MNNTLPKANPGIGATKIVKKTDLDQTLIEAKSSDKFRLPILLNNSFDEVPQRFVNCLTVSTYVRPHCHPRTCPWELMSWLDGIIYIILFDHSGKIIDKLTMSRDDVRVIEIPSNLYHTFITPSTGVYLEVRGSSYNPDNDRMYATWAPP